MTTPFTPFEDHWVTAFREDAAFGAAWRRCEAALPEGWDINMLWGTVTEDRWAAHAGPFPAPRDGSYGGQTAGGPTPTAALTALAEALESRKAAAG